MTKAKPGYKLVKSLFGKEIEIPENWILENLSNLDVMTSSGGTPDRENKIYYAGDNIWIKSGELKDDFIFNSEEKITNDALKNSSAKIFPKNTVLVAMYGATIGKTGILGKDGSTNQAICGILPNSKFIPIFLQQFLLLRRNLLVSFGMGAGQPNISQDLIKNFKYLVPPLSEQTKIASILFNVDSLISIYSDILKTTNHLKTGLIQQLLVKGIGHKKFKKVKTLFGKYEEIPDSWKYVKLIEKCSKKPDYGASVSAIEKDTKLYRYIRITDLNHDGSLRDKEWKSIYDDNAKNYILNDGDILFARTGATVGKTFLYKKNYGKCAFAGYLIRFVLDPNHLIPEFLFYFTHSTSYLKWLRSIQTWGVQPNVNAEQYSNMRLFLPPLYEQQKIITMLSTIDLKIIYYELKKSDLDKLKKGLMQKLLFGQIKV